MSNIARTVLRFLGIQRPPPHNSVLPSSRSFQQSMLNDGSETATRGQLVQIMMRDLLRKSGIPPGWVQCQVQVVNSRTKGQGIYVRLVVKQWDERLMKYAFAFQKALLTDIVQFEPRATTWLQGIAWQLEVAGSCPVTQLPSSEFWKTHGVVDPFEIIPMPASAMPTPAYPATGKSPTTPPMTPPMTAPMTAPILPIAAASVAVVGGTKASSPSFDLDPIQPLPQLMQEPNAFEDDTADDLERLFAIRDKELENQAVNNLLPMGYERTEPSPL